MSNRIFEICELLAATIKADATLSAYCAQHFGQAHQVLIGFDPANPPPAEQMPWVAIVPAAAQIDEDMTTREYTLDIAFAGINATIDTTTTTGITVWTGYQKVYEVANMIQEIIYTALQPSQNNPNNPFTLKDLGRVSVDLAHPRYLASWQVRAGSAI